MKKQILLVHEDRLCQGEAELDRKEGKIFVRRLGEAAFDTIDKKDLPKYVTLSAIFKKIPKYLCTEFDSLCNIADELSLKHDIDCRIARYTIDKLTEKYHKLKYDINCYKADSSLSKLCSLQSEFDDTFDAFFDQKYIRVKYKDWDKKSKTPLLEKTMSDLLKEFDLKDLLLYIEFYKNYLYQLELEKHDFESLQNQGE